MKSACNFVIALLEVRKVAASKTLGIREDVLIQTGAEGRRAGPFLQPSQYTSNEAWGAVDDAIPCTSWLFCGTRQSGP